MLGIKYDILLGKGNEDIYASFSVEPVVFEKRLEQFLAS